MTVGYWVLMYMKIALLTLLIFCKKKVKFHAIWWCA
jgi:hypothetical protein